MQRRDTARLCSTELHKLMAPELKGPTSELSLSRSLQTDPWILNETSENVNIKNTKRFITKRGKYLFPLCTNSSSRLPQLSLKQGCGVGKLQHLTSLYGLRSWVRKSDDTGENEKKSPLLIIIVTRSSDTLNFSLGFNLRI